MKILLSILIFLLSSLAYGEVNKFTNEKNEIAKKIKLNVENKNKQELIKILNTVYNNAQLIEDKKFIKLIVNYTWNTIIKSSTCEEKIEIVNLFSKNYDFKNKRIDDTKLIYILAFIEQKNEDSSVDWDCNSKIYESYLITQLQNLVESKKYELYNAVFITKVIYESQGNKFDRYEDNEYKNLFNIQDFINASLSLETEEQRDEGLYFLKKVKDYLPTYIYEKIITENEHYLFEKDNNDIKILEKMELIGGYFTGEKWPFKRSKKETILKLIDYKYKDKKIKDNFLIMLVNPLLDIAREEEPKKAKKLYAEIKSIKSEELSKSLFKDWKDKTSKEDAIKIYSILLDGFKLNAALDSGDLKEANIIYKKNRNKLDEILINTKKESKLNKYIEDGLIFSLLKQYFNFNNEIKNKEEAYRILKLALSKTDLDLDRLEEDKYIINNKNKYKNKINSLLYMIKDYYKLIKKDTSYIELAISSYDPNRYRSTESIIRGLFFSVNNLDKDDYILDLKFLKDDLENLKHDKSYYLISLYYDDLNNQLSNFPEANSDEEIKSKFRNSFTINFLDFYSLMYLNQKDTDSYSNNKFNSYKLFSINKNNSRTEEAYFYSKEYLNIIKNIKAESLKSVEVERLFSDSITDEIDEIIDFYLLNDMLTDAKEAISIFKEQKFLNIIKRTSSDANFNNTLIESPVTNYFKSKIAELNLLNSKIDKTNSEESKLKLEQIKNQLNIEIKKSYEEKKNKDNNQKEVPPIKKYNIENNTAHVDYYIKSNILYIIYYSNISNKKFTQVLPIDFSRKISKLHQLYTNPRSEIIEITKIKSELSELISKPIEKNINDENINTIYIRSNLFLSSVPFVHLLNVNYSNQILNIVYEGVSNNNSNNFSLNEKASLFGTNMKHGELPALTYVSKELNSILNLYTKKYMFNNKSRIYINEMYSLLNFTNAFKSDSNVIHLSTHFSNEKNGSLLLGNGDKISSRQLWKFLPYSSTSRLVTISACDSGLLSNNDEVSENLPNVFLNKGSQYVIASTWKISDKATAFFMDVYYSILLISGDPVLSLNLTQHIFRDGNYNIIKTKYSNIFNSLNTNENQLKNYSHPFYWASFQIIAAQKLF